MVLDEVSSEMLRRKLDDARFLAMWVANGSPPSFVWFAATWRRRWRFARSAKPSLCALNCARANADNGNV